MNFIRVKRSREKSFNIFPQGSPLKLKINENYGLDELLTKFAVIVRIKKLLKLQGYLFQIYFHKCLTSELVSIDYVYV